MNKQELIDQVATSADISKKQAEDALNAMTDIISKQLSQGKKVTITGFGTFSVSHRAARTGVNPQNPSQKIQIAAVDVPKFKAGKSFKEAIR